MLISFFTKNALRTSFCALAISFLSACGGGGGGDDGSRQGFDPVVVDLAVAYVRRDISEDDIDDDLQQPADSSAGAELYIRDRASPSAGSRNITAGVFAANAEYDVKDVEVSFDGNKLLFAMRAPLIPGLEDDDPAQPSWNIWEYDTETSNLERVIESNIIAEAGHDISPHYLPSGRIVFTSTRNQRTRAILVDEGKPQYSPQTEIMQVDAFNLHTMASDGLDVRQISFNQSHDLNPSVLPTGQVMFTRWDAAAGNNSLSLYSINPDGRQLSFLYGYHSQFTGTDISQAALIKPKRMPGGDILAMLRPNQTEHRGGDIIRVNHRQFTELVQRTALSPFAPGFGHKSLSFREVTTDGTPSPHGHFSAAFPLFDGTDRLLVSWSQCRLEDPEDQAILPCTDENLSINNITEADPIYGIWIYDLDSETQKTVVPPEEGVMYTEVVALASRPQPDWIPDGEPGVDLDTDLVNERVGVLHIRSVYDLDGTNVAGSTAVLADPTQTAAPARPARFLRIVKAVYQPDDDTLDFDNSAFGRSAAQLMREVIGYTMIEPDGSVKVKVPANVPLAISVLDAEGKRIFGRHQNWLQVMPGEERECKGCHAAGSIAPHGRPGAEVATVNSGAPSTGSPFPNTAIAMIASQGETMAETRARINGVSDLSVDIIYRDLWSNINQRPLDPDIDLLYADLDPTLTAPTTQACQLSWNYLCRTIINYPTHIAPLWELDRGPNTCTNCHNTLGNTVEPDAQLELVNLPSAANANHLESYRELLFPDVVEQVINGTLQPIEVQDTDANGNLLFLTDNQGNLILDAMDNPIPIMVPVPQAPPLSTAGALFSPRFYAPFAAGASHEGYLSPAELRLVSEWVDIGAQYYNNPFDAPLN